MRTVLLVLLLASAACRPAAAAMSTPSPLSEQGLRATVTKVVDGDTVDVRIAGNDEVIRLIGVDTPETVKPNSPVECFGPEASARTKALLPPGTEVLLLGDEERRDVYGRLLAYVFRADDGTFVNLTLVQEGMGDVLVIAPNDAFAGAFRAAAAAARSARVGQWGGCPTAQGSAGR